jgi:hypothetical protein
VSDRRAWIQPGLVIAGCVAALVIYGMLFGLLPPGRFIPWYADEIYYYKQAESFLTLGFAHGYWGGEQQAAPVGGCDVHGCGFMVVTGAFGRLFGWHHRSMVVFNGVCLAAAIAVSVLMLRRERDRLRLIGTLWVVVLTAGVSIIYLESGMQEMLHLFGVVVMSLFAWRVVATDGAAGWLTAYLLAGTALGLVRFTWGIYLPAVILLISRRRVMAGAAGTLLALGVYYLAQITRPADSFESPLLKGRLLAGTLRNLRELVTVTPGELTVTAVRVSWWVTLVAVPLVWLLRRPRSPERKLVFWAWSMLAATTVLQVFFYICYNHGDYRVMSLPMLGVMIALVLVRDQWLLTGLLALQLACAPLALSLVLRWNAQRPQDSALIATRSARLRALVDDAKQVGGSRWCRTLVMEFLNLRVSLPHLLSAPAGYGIEIVRVPANLAHHPARYVVSERRLEAPRFVSRGEWERGVYVYENSESGCASR